MDEKEFWDRVKQVLKKKGLTCKAMAKACKIPLNTFYGWMYKSIFPGLVDTLVMARFLGVTVEYLVTGRESRPRLKLKKVRDLLQKAGEKLEEMENDALL